MGKRVIKHDRYTYRDTEYLTVKTADGWLYRFNRPDDAVPFTFDRRMRADGTWSDRKNRIPEAVREYVRGRFDAAQLDPERFRSESARECSR